MLGTGGEECPCLIWVASSRIFALSLSLRTPQAENRRPLALHPRIVPRIIADD